MSEQGNPPSGLVKKVVGKVKETAGSLVGNEDLEREGELEQTQAEAERKAAGGDQRGFHSQGHGLTPCVIRD